jgi:hypothetical protein
MMVSSIHFFSAFSASSFLTREETAHFLFKPQNVDHNTTPTNFASCIGRSALGSGLSDHYQTPQPIISLDNLFHFRIASRMLMWLAANRPGFAFVAVSQVNTKHQPTVLKFK